jgi:hypothetical protein
MGMICGAFKRVEIRGKYPSSRGGLEDNLPAIRFFGPLWPWPGYDLDIQVERRKKSHQALNRIFAKIPFEQSRHLRLRNAHNLSRLVLGELARIGQPIKLGHDLRLQKVAIGSRQT